MKKINPFMYAIQAPDGTAYMDEGCVCEDAQTLKEETVCYLNEEIEDENMKYKVVPVYLAVDKS